MSRKRSELLNMFHAGNSFKNALNKMQDGVLYRLEIPSGKIYLQEWKDDIFRGVFYDEKGISNHAGFSQIHPSIVDCAKAIGAQCLLLKISMQLVAIEGKIDRIFQGLRNDRIAEIQAGTAMYHRAIDCDPQVRNSLLAAALPTLHSGLAKCILDLRDEIQRLPSFPKSFLGALSRQYRPGNNLANDAEFKLQPVFELLTALSTGARSLTGCYTELGEHAAAQNAFSEISSTLRRYSAETLETYVRQLPVGRENELMHPTRLFLNGHVAIDALHKNQEHPIYLELTKGDLTDE